MLMVFSFWWTSNWVATGNVNFEGYDVKAWCGRVRPSPPEVFGAMVGAGPESVVTGCFTGMIGIGSMKARVGGLVPVPPPPSFAQAAPDAQCDRPCFQAR
jgi:hypothetical protein